MLKLKSQALASLAVTALAVAALATPASAAGTPGAPYTGLGDCPLSTSTMRDPGNLQVACFVSVTRSGTMTIGTHTVAFTKPTTVQFGAYWPGSGPAVTFPDGTSANVYSTVAPTDGKELVVAQVEVPIPGLVNILPGVTSVYAQVMLAGPIASFVPLATGESYPVFNLPIKIKLTSNFLGSTCYIGSDAHPIVLQPTTGTTSPPAPNQPISGDPGSLDIVNDPHGHSAIVASFTGATLVDNAFAVPAASGCGLFGLLDPVVNSVFGLPSAAGNNAVVFSQTDSSLAIDDTISDLAGAIAASSH